MAQAREAAVEAVTRGYEVHRFWNRTKAEIERQDKERRQQRLMK